MRSPHITIDSDPDAGFRLLYELRFDPARERFAVWEQQHPTEEFFLDDNRLLGGISGGPDALFALTLTAGMRADNAALIEKKQIESLRLLRESDRNARELPALAPGGEDAYLAFGAANYIVGCMPAYKRLLLWVGGIHGDKALGLRRLSRADSDGHYLQPYAKVLLAMAALREKNTNTAHIQLAELAAAFPGNPLFAAELAKANLDAVRTPSPAVP